MCVFTVTQLFKLMEKYRPETAAMKKRRLQVCLYSIIYDNFLISLSLFYLFILIFMFYRKELKIK